MINLSSIINQYGQPKAIIDYPNKNNVKKMVFDFSDSICLKPDKTMLVNNQIIKGNCLEVWQNQIEKWKSETKDDDIAAIGFFSYDFKNIIYPNYQFKKPQLEDMPYFWFGKPKKMIDIEDFHYDFNYQKIDLKTDIQDLKKFEKIINNIKEYLYSGDTYQINYTQPIRFNFEGSCLDLYMQIKDDAKPKYGFYLDINEAQVLSFSPEKFFTKQGSEIESYPIKGTIKKLGDKERDQLQIKKLSNSQKDKAEHLMIVDLIRNDIGKISKFGSVNVKQLFSIETFETIHHMVSKITGSITSDIKEIDIIKALFPGGSITGAPKFKSMQIIDNLEDYNRNLYTGCIGSVLGNGDMDFNICIRTMTIKNNDAVYPVGGGIVWDSNAEEEHCEAQQKANILKY